MTSLISPMAQLIVRGLERRVVDLLKRRAAERGHSAEEEHRRLLVEALVTAPRTSLKEHLLGIPRGGTNEDFARHDDHGRKAAL